MTHSSGACEQCEAFDAAALGALTGADCPNPLKQRLGGANRGSNGPNHHDPPISAF